MKTIKEPIVKEGRNNGKTRKGPNMGIFSILFAALLAQKTGEDKKIRGASLIGYNPIFTPRRGKLKGYQKKSQLSTFNKNR